MTGRIDMVETLLRQLHELEHRRRQAGAVGDHGEANRLAAQIPELIRAQAEGVVRSSLHMMVVDTVLGDRWPRCEACGKPTYQGDAVRRGDAR